jgi:UDP-4-amino-4,6-dideoxy-N-acetyl-beta-L-altrosamine N-acetyltransferase
MNIVLKNYTLATDNEHRSLLEIRNSPSVLQWTHAQKPIDFNEHATWVRHLTSDTSMYYYMIILDGKIMGGINIFNIQKQEAFWGIFTKEGNPVLNTMVTYYFLDYVFEKFNLEMLHLEVHTSNTNAYKFDKQFGFSDTLSEENSKKFHHMSLSKTTWESTRILGTMGIIKKQLQKHSFHVEEG